MLKRYYKVSWLCTLKETVTVLTCSNILRRKISFTISWSNKCEAQDSAIIRPQIKSVTVIQRTLDPVGFYEILLGFNSCLS